MRKKCLSGIGQVPDIPYKRSSAACSYQILLLKNDTNDSIDYAGTHLPFNLKHTKGE
jgi:hypothetical protein